MESIKEQIMRADQFLSSYISTAENIAQQIVDAVYEATGIKLDWVFRGCYDSKEAGIEFQYENEEIGIKRFKQYTEEKIDLISLISILNDIFSENEKLNYFYIYALGILFTPEEAEKIKELLSK